MHTLAITTGFKAVRAPRCPVPITQGGLVLKPMMFCKRSHKQMRKAIPMLRHTPFSPRARAVPRSRRQRMQRPGNPSARQSGLLTRALARPARATLPMLAAMTQQVIRCVARREKRLRARLSRTSVPISLVRHRLQYPILRRALQSQCNSWKPRCFRGETSGLPVEPLTKVLQTT